MAELPSSFDAAVLPSPSAVASSSGSASADADADDGSFEDACSICLEPFTAYDPATVTNCKHEYHLQCIVEWSQRSKDCPICWQILSLKDPASQELLATVESERSLRTSQISVSQEEFHCEHVAPNADDSDFNERIMQHLAAAARRARFMSRRERQRSPGLGASHRLFSGSPENADEMQQTMGSPQEYSNSGYGSSEPDSLTSSTPVSINGQSPSDVISSVVNMMSDTDANRDGIFKPSARVSYSESRSNSPIYGHPSNSPQRPSASELLSESIKSKFSAASARYKESLSKGTRGLKEKLLARNNSVKELSKGVQREMSAGVARMLERLDPMLKRTCSPVPSCNVGTSNISCKGKGVQENVNVQSLDGNNVEAAHDINVDTTSHASATIPVQFEVFHAQGGH